MQRKMKEFPGGVLIGPPAKSAKIHPVWREPDIIEVHRTDEGLLPEGKHQETISKIRPFAKTGNHYHEKKLELACVLFGFPAVCWQDGEGQKYFFNLSPESRVFIPARIPHAYLNLCGLNATILEIQNTLFDEGNRDAYPCSVIDEGIDLRNKSFLEYLARNFKDLTSKF